MLDERKMMVLRALVEDYVQTAEPVGSRTIARKYQLGVSPATIRNEMADLEETGYLQQPHVSAGRIPSDKGYRYYVDMLMEPHVISEEQTRRVYGDVAIHRQEIDRLIQEASRILAMLTQSVSVVVAPPVESLALRHLQLVSIDDQNVLVVLVLNPSIVYNKIIATRRPYSPEELGILSQDLNKRLRGITYRELGVSIIRELTDGYGDIGRSLLEVLAASLMDEKQEKVHMNGVINILNQPEFKDVDRARTLFEILEEREVLLRMVGEMSKTSGVHAIIGHENSRIEVQECSLVTASYEIGGKVIGTIGVIGPTRMEYAKVFSMVELMAGSLSEILSELVK